MSNVTKIISYSLWGSNAMYLHGALMNARQCKEFFPDWKVRIYHNDSISDDLLVKLRELGVETVLTKPNGTYGTFWRFYPMFEDYNYILVRDIDARITWRDVRCVNEWIESGKKFMNIRDHHSHYDWPIIAGMFGTRGGALPLSLIPIMNKYEIIHQYVSDQVFLARHVWDYMKHDVYELGFNECKWMSDTWTVDGHMNLGFDENDAPRTNHGTMMEPCI